MAKRLRTPEFDLLLGPFEDLRQQFVGSNAQTRLQIALFLSIVLHAIVALGVTFRPPARLHNTTPTLEVVLVNSRTARMPEKPVALAQANLDGGGNTDAEHRAKSPLPVLKRADSLSDMETASRKVEQLEREAQKLLAQVEKQSAVVERTDPSPQPRPEPVQTPDASEIRNRSREILALQAQIARDLNAYQTRPRREFIGAQTREMRFARYVEDWRMKIERVGTLNYPQAARDQRLYGTLLLTVSIRRDGTVESVEINAPSGQKVLDEAAKRIVQLAAPFAPFPPEIAKDTDFVSITRRWTFTRDDAFQAE